MAGVVRPREAITPVDVHADAVAGNLPSGKAIVGTDA
jgi:hypothetical protein